MFHVDFQGPTIGSSMAGTLAHELHHMISWRQSPLDGDLARRRARRACQLAGDLGSGPGTSSLQRRPNVQLTTWAQGGDGSLHYQASYLFARYFAQRFGREAVRPLLNEQGARRIRSRRI